MKLIVIQSFDWAHQGVRVERFEAGTEFETDDQDLIDVSKREGWAKSPDERAAPPAALDGEVQPSAKPGRQTKAKE